MNYKQITNKLQTNYKQQIKNKQTRNKSQINKQKNKMKTTIRNKIIVFIIIIITIMTSINAISLNELIDSYNLTYPQGYLENETQTTTTTTTFRNNNNIINNSILLPNQEIFLEDINKNEKIDNIKILSTIKVNETGNYKLKILISDKFGKEIISTTRNKFISNIGNISFELNLFGKDFYVSKINGPYIIKSLSIYKENILLESLLDINIDELQNLTYLNFEKPPMPDLYVPEFQYNNLTKELNIIIKNQGNADAIRFSYKILDNNYDILYENIINYLEINNSENLSLNFINNPLNLTEFVIIVDYYNSIEEMNETNNLNFYPHKNITKLISNSSNFSKINDNENKNQNQANKIRNSNGGTSLSQPSSSSSNYKNKNHNIINLNLSNKTFLTLNNSNNTINRTNNLNDGVNKSKYVINNNSYNTKTQSNIKKTKLSKNTKKPISNNIKNSKKDNLKKELFNNYDNRFWNEINIDKLIENLIKKFILFFQNIL